MIAKINYNLFEHDSDKWVTVISTYNKAYLLVIFTPFCFL